MIAGLRTSFTWVLVGLQTLLLASVGLVFLTWNRVDLCDALLARCGTGGGSSTEYIVIAAVVVTLALMALARHRLKPVWLRVTNDDRPDWVRWAFLATTWISIVALALVIVTRVIASVGPRGTFDLIPDPNMGVPIGVIGISIVLASLPIAASWMLTVSAKTLHATIGQSPVTAGMRQFRGRVLEPTQSVGGGRAPGSGEPCAAWVIEAQQRWYTDRGDWKYGLKPDRTGELQVSQEWKQKLKWYGSWAWVHGSGEPVAVHTTDGTVLLDMASLVLEAVPIWGDDYGSWRNRPIFAELSEHMEFLDAVRFRVTALPWGAEVVVTGLVFTADDELPWVTALRMPHVPQEKPHRFVRKDGLRSLVQQPVRAREKLVHR